jgi:F0F1-type ATP synthase assembly protein I
MSKGFVTGVVVGAVGLWVLDRFVFKTPGTSSSNHG